MTLRDLLARCERATGANYALEVEIRGALEKSRPSHLTTPCYTCSLDDAVALVERMLPGWSWHADKHGDGICWGCVWINDENTPNHLVEGKTPALALICALLKAMIDRGDGDA